MCDVFQEIAFQAEVSVYDDPEFEETALELCEERPSTRAAALWELRCTILDRGECAPHRMDDAYLLRFLRARRFIVPLAHKLMVRYYAFREEYPYLYRDVDVFGLFHVKGAYEGVLADHPDIGRIIIFRFGAWNPNEYPVEDLVRAGMLLLEIGMRQPKLQVLGCTVLFDLEGLTLRHLRNLTPTIAYQIVSLMGTSMPSRMRNCHIVNYSWIFNTCVFLFKRFIPSYAWKRIYFHGQDLNSLHAHVPPSCLPPRYGGTCKNHVTFGHWLGKIKKYRDEQFDSDMRALGYVVKE